jgi:uncharacterized membrane protein YiaA
MKKYIIPLAIIAFIFVAFFLLLLWTDTPKDLSLVGSGITTLLIGTYAGLSFIGKPIEIIRFHYEKYTNIKKTGVFLGTVVLVLTVSNALIGTIEATMETLPFGIYCIAFLIAVILGAVNRKIFISLAAED